MKQIREVEAVTAELRLALARVGVVLPSLRGFKQTLGWTAPKLRKPAAADRWTWLVSQAWAARLAPGRMR